MKKFLTLFTTFCIVFSMLGAFTVFAEETAADLEISTLAELEAFRDDVNGGNTYEDKTVKLTADIDMSEKYGEGKESWMPIGTFAGIFDGGNNTINELYINTDEQLASLFSSITGTIKNLNVKGSVSTTNNAGNASGIAGTVEKNGSITECSFEGNINSKDNSSSGIALINLGSISKCNVSGEIIGKSIVGGIAGYVNGGMITNCTNNSEVRGYSPVGGIAAKTNNASIVYCSNNGWVRGYANTSAIDAPNGFNIGGIVGLAEGNTLIECCYNTAMASGGGYIGGILGCIDINENNDFLVTIKNCYNISNIGGMIVKGGIFGGIYDSLKEAAPVIKIQNCYNMGYVSGGGEFPSNGITDGISEGYGEVINSYYLNNSGFHNSDAEKKENAKSITAFKNGEVAYLLNGGTSEGELVWYQTIGEDDFPVLNSLHSIVLFDGENFRNNNTYTPYEINNIDDFVAFGRSVRVGHSYLDEVVTLNADIDLSTVCGENINGEEISWKPIGSTETDKITEEFVCQFLGTFNGNGHKISGLYQNYIALDDDNIGLFGYNCGTIKNLSVSGFVNAHDNIGGIVGYNAGTVEQCSFSGTAAGRCHVGGIIGQNKGQVNNCYNTGTIETKLYGGGITGLNYGTIECCYNTGAINRIPKDNNEYAKYFGSITGSDSKNVVNCYYLEGTYDKGVYTNGSDNNITDPTTALTAEQFADKSNFTNWDFENVWKMDDTLKRPVLLSNTEEQPTQTHTHKICGDENCTDNHEDVEWTAWDSETALPTETGNYYLTKDVVLADYWLVQDEPVNLCLNGHIITTRESGLSIENNVILTDCSDTLHRFTPDTDGIWVLDEENGVKTLSGGVVTGFANVYTTQSLIVISEGTLDMYNINITGNKPSKYADAAHKGGGVTNHGIFNMHSGKIIGNGAGVYNLGNSTFNITDGEIVDNGIFGIYSEHNTILSVGGTAIVKNVYLYNDIIIKVNKNNPFTDGAYINITSYTAPTEENPIDITGANDADYSKYFHSDNENYKIVNGENNIIQLVVNDDKIKPYMSRMFFNDHNIKSEKVTSLNQLKELVCEQYDYDGIAEKYDEAFFNDKFLYLYHIDDGNSGNVYNITSAENAENSINIAVTQKADRNTDDIVQWFLVVEIDKSLYNKDINVNFTDLQLIDYSIKYKNEKAVVTAEKDGTYTIIFAAYDNGRLLSVNARDIQLVKGENEPIEPYNFNASGKVKVMLWDSLKGMKPLCAADEN